MNEGKEILDRVIQQTTGIANPHSYDQGLQRFAYDIRLPQPVKDAYSGDTAWAQDLLPGKFVDFSNPLSFDESFWVRPASKPSSLNELLALWSEINIMSASRAVDCLNVFESDNIYTSENVVRSVDVTSSKNILWCDRVENCEYVVASQRSRDCSFHCASKTAATAAKASASAGLAMS